MYRELVDGCDMLVTLANGTKCAEVYLDNAATTPPLKSVCKELQSFIPCYASVHRGAGLKSRMSDEMLENARMTALSFVGGNPDHDVAIFVNNTTDGINQLAVQMAEELVNPISGKAATERDVIISSVMEHHSNILPWRNSFFTEYVEVDSAGRLLMDDLEAKLRRYNGRVRLVTVAGASNVTGYVNPIHEIAALAHTYGAEALVDAAQLAPHRPIDLQAPGTPGHIDYIVFSAHKMYAPFGVGVLIGPRSFFSRNAPARCGGGTVRSVTLNDVLWEDPPLKNEAGTPNLLGILALGSAISSLRLLGFDELMRHESEMTKYCLTKLRSLPGVTVYPDDSDKPRVGVITFNVFGYPHDQLAKALADKAGIAVRSGCFCAEPYAQRLLGISDAEAAPYRGKPKNERPGMVRASLGIQNSKEDIDFLINTLLELQTRNNKRLL